MITIIKQVEVQDLRKFMYNEFQNCVNDKKLYECINDGNSINVFQMSAGTASQVVSQIHPDNLEELTACNAFARPGTISGVPAYIEGKEGKLKYKNPIINSVFGETFGICLYQESVMKVVELLSPKKEKIIFTLEDGSKKEFNPDDKINTNNGVKFAKDITNDDEIML